MSHFRLVIVFLAASACLGSGSVAVASDWPQFLRDSQHTGDAADELLSGPLRLVCRVQLDDAVLTSPVVVDGKVFVVDQMGTAYCVDPVAQRVIWKSNPEGQSRLGGHTSSPCVGEGRLFYGTTAGNLYILGARSGERIKTVAFGQSILDSITQANDSVCLEMLDAVVHCLDSYGNPQWQWDHCDLHRGSSAPGGKRQYGGAAVPEQIKSTAGPPFLLFGVPASAPSSVPSLCHPCSFFFALFRWHGWQGRGTDGQVL